RDLHGAWLPVDGEVRPTVTPALVVFDAHADDVVGRRVEGDGHERPVEGVAALGDRRRRRVHGEGAVAGLHGVDVAGPQHLDPGAQVPVAVGELHGWDLVASRWDAVT